MNLENLPKRSLISEYCEQLTTSSDQVLLREYEVIRGAAADYNNRFATVIIRTKGNRSLMLQEVLLCLMAQDSDNFEIIVSGHGLDDLRTNKLLELIDSFPSRFKSRITLINSHGGDRSRPINTAMDLLRTSYFVILDDDDLVFSNWISAFENAARKFFGKIVHSGVYTQKWRRYHNGDKEVTEAIAAPKPTFCTQFDLIRQFRDNACPIMSVAYPSFLAKELGFRFDENLTTLEDWDFLQRAAIVCGVEDSHQNTSIYRLWENSDASHDARSNKDWEVNRVSVDKKFESLIILLPPNYLKRILEHIKVDQAIEIDSSRSKLECLMNNGNTLFISPNKFNYDYEVKRNTVDFSLQELDGIKRLTFIPTINNQVTLVDFTAKLTYENGESTVLSKWDLVGNGYITKQDEWTFIQQPHVELFIRGDKKIRTCEYSFIYKNYIDESILIGTKIFMRFKSSLKRKIYKFKKRFI